MDLEPTSGTFVPPTDSRARMEEPLPVQIIAVADVRLIAVSGLEMQLDALYVGLLEFQRDASVDGLVYRADNFRVIFQIVEPPLVRQDYRYLYVIVKSLADTERKLVEAEIEYTRQRGLMPGQESLVLTDPAGNWLEITEAKVVG